jgi:hypothetical protein
MSQHMPEDELDDDSADPDEDEPLGYESASKLR